MNDEHDQERYIDELASDHDLARVDGIGALHMPAVDELVMRAEEGEGDDEMEERVRAETMSRLLEFLFEDGAEPWHLSRRAWLLAKNLRQDILRRFRMESLESYARQLGCTRAAMCAANQRIIVRLVEVAERRAGRNHGSFKASFQKTATNVEKLAAAQRRTQGKNGANRSKGKKQRSTISVEARS